MYSMLVRILLHNLYTNKVNDIHLYYLESLNVFNLIKIINWSDGNRGIFNFDNYILEKVSDILIFLGGNKSFLSFIDHLICPVGTM